MGLWGTIKSKLCRDPLVGGVLEGAVKWYNITKGFGFIQCKALPEDVFLHASDLSLEWKNYIPKEGDRVWFLPKRTSKGFRALKIVIMED